MKLLEYEAKAILKSYEITVPKSSLISKQDKIVSLPVVLKSQVPVGGRGKAGGVRVINKSDDAKAIINEMLSLPIKGHLPSKLLAEELLQIEHEYYLSLTINRAAGSVELLAHQTGGIEIEEQSSFKRWLLTEDGTNLRRVGGELAQYFNQEDKNQAITTLLINLFQCFTKNDATLIEINPLALTADGHFVAADCKMTLDDAASFRHPNWNFEDQTASHNFVTLNQDGQVATIANGAGLAMATVDGVASSGLVPANFLDIGGGANEASVLAAFQKIMEYPNVAAIVINIFAGITRCDEVAKAIIAAKVRIPGLPKLYIRLAGTNYEEAKKLLDDAGIGVLSSLDLCLDNLKKDLK